MVGNFGEGTMRMFPAHHQRPRSQDAGDELLLDLPDTKVNTPPYTSFFDKNKCRNLRSKRRSTQIHTNKQAIYPCTKPPLSKPQLL